MVVRTDDVAPRRRGCIVLDDFSPIKRKRRECWANLAATTAPQACAYSEDEEDEASSSAASSAFSTSFSVPITRVDLPSSPRARLRSLLESAAVPSTLLVRQQQQQHQQQQTDLLLQTAAERGRRGGDGGAGEAAGQQPRQRSKSQDGGRPERLAACAAPATPTQKRRTSRSEEGRTRSKLAGREEEAVALEAVWGDRPLRIVLEPSGSRQFSLQLLPLWPASGRLAPRASSSLEKSSASAVVVEEEEIVGQANVVLDGGASHASQHLDGTPRKSSMRSSGRRRADPTAVDGGAFFATNAVLCGATPSASRAMALCAAIGALGFDELALTVETASLEDERLTHFRKGWPLGTCLAMHLGPEWVREKTPRAAPSWPLADRLARWMEQPAAGGVETTSSPSPSTRTVTETLQRAVSKGRRALRRALDRLVRSGLKQHEDGVALLLSLRLYHLRGGGGREGGPPRQEGRRPQQPPSPSRDSRDVRGKKRSVRWTTATTATSPHH